MKRSSRIITFLIVTALTYGSLFAFVGPEKVRDWHKSHRFHREHYYNHHHHENLEKDHVAPVEGFEEREQESEAENL